MTSPEQFSIDRNLVEIHNIIGNTYTGNPRFKALLKGGRLQCRKQPSDGVVRRNPVRKFKSFPELGFVIFGPCPDRPWPVSSGDHGHDADDNQIAEQVSPINIDSPIFERLKFLKDRVNVVNNVWTSRSLRQGVRGNSKVESSIIAKNSSQRNAAQVPRMRVSRDNMEALLVHLHSLATRVGIVTVSRGSGSTAPLWGGVVKTFGGATDRNENSTQCSD